MRSSCIAARGSRACVVLATLALGCGDSDGGSGFTDIAAPSGGSGGSGGSGASSGASGGNAGTIGGGSSAPPDACAGDDAEVQRKIFDARCVAAGCHGGDAPAANMDLSGGDTLGQLAMSAALCDGWTRVVPGEPDRSLLYVKLTGNVPAGCGERMPIGGALSDADQACVRLWIEGLTTGDLPGPGGCETCGEAGCVDLQSDPAHCGDCAVACNPGEVCNQGLCDAGGCGALAQCGQACIDTATSALHCGACDAACGADQQCVSGACTCLDGRPVCDGSCVDTDFDPNHCGGCGQACDAGEACTGGQCGCGSATASFSADVLPIVTTKCAAAGCHSGMRPQAGLSLTAATAYAELVGVAASQCNDGRMRVAPGAPAESYLVDKLLGIDLCFGTQMPKSGQSLPASELEAISAWICAGAAND